MAAPLSTDDPLVAIVMDPKVIDIASTLVAKLEYVAYDETRRGVFKTHWGRALFDSCVKRMFGPEKPLEIDSWYHDVMSTKKPGRTDYSIAPGLHDQAVETNWLGPLFELEIKMPGILHLLHNTLDLEDKTHSKLAEKTKQETQYDFLGLGQRNAALRITQGSSTQAEKRKLIKPK